MKRFFSIMLLAMCSIALVAQSNDNQDEVVKIDQSNRQAYREGEVIVKFKPQGQVQMRRNVQGRFETAGVNAVDALFAELGVEEVEQLMPNVGARKAPRRMRAYNGAEVQDHDMSKLYLLRFSSPARVAAQDPAAATNAEYMTVQQVVEQLQALEEVEFAEPNYMVYSLSVDVNADKYNKEPLYTQQWGPAAIGLPSIWNKSLVTNKRPVIAIIDTGVDTEHPDLASNVWVNEAEKSGVTGKDDDGNGVVDDVHGYDFVNKTGKMRDNNGHGTHCAGIAAAVGHNGIGITGANPHALIMPVTVMQSDGSGDVATIIKGIDYAAANGADVISMSLGGYGYSIAEEQALGKAYATAVIVAAAGNDGHDLTGYHCMFDAPMYPAAFQFVLGVEASANKQGSRASFSNFDADGPIFSLYSSETQLYNYELRAPGVNVVSTFPGGQYRELNGTSMACPLAAGAISRLLMHKEYDSWEILFGDLIHTRTNRTGNIDMKAAYDITEADRKPTLSLVTYQLTDSLGDNDDRADAGDTIAFWPVLRNDWGNAKNVQVWLELTETEDKSTVRFLAQRVRFGANLSSYAKSKSVNPILFVVDKNVVDGRRISMVLRATCDNISAPLEQDVVLSVENGVELGGMISEDLTLYPDVHYIVTSKLLVPKGITLTIMPGTVIKIKDGMGIQCDGNLVANGTPDSLIVFTKTDLGLGNITTLKLGTNTISYAKFENLTFSNGDWGLASSGAVYNDCVFNNINGGYPIHGGVYTHCTTKNLYGWTGLIAGSSLLQYCNVVGNSYSHVDYFSLTRLENCNAFSNTYRGGEGNIYVSVGYGVGSVTDYKPTYPSYLGSANEKTLRSWILDAAHPTNPKGSGIVNLDYVAKEPIREAHGIVWKVVVNGYDAQDEFHLLPPLGVGTHKFEVYFNRPMDTSVTPYISMGVRAPYTQNSISENGSWNAEGTIYTAYLTIKGKTNTDGLNRIYVAEAKDDEHFEIPIEDKRFNVQVAAAGSLSTGLVAEAGLGKVELSWKTDAADFADLLGYNIYRWTEDTIKWNRYYDSECKCYVEAGWKFDTICINDMVLDPSETDFQDYDVVPGKTYYYYIKQINTSLTSYNLSAPVAATPLTSMKGDANGTARVDVADVVTLVNYLTGGNPQPFIFEAADVNSDGTINVLDIIGAVNILFPSKKSSTLAFADEATAVYTVEDGILYVETPVVLGGVQFEFNAEAGHEFECLEALDGFEVVSDWIEDNTYLVMAYSLSGKTLGVGKHALMRIGDATVDEVVLSTPEGSNVVAVNGDATTDLSVVEGMQMKLARPNPFTHEVTIPYVIGQSGNHHVQLIFTNIAGLTVGAYSANQSFGEYAYTWRPSALPAGVYFVTLYVDNKKMQCEKLVHIQ